MFGVANFSPARRVGRNLDELAAAVVADLDGREPRSFRVTARRADKTYAFTSPEIEREVGGRIKAARGWNVDLSNPDLVVRIEMLAREAFYSLDRHPGPGGLPSGVSGPVLCLLSGGIDSPVAAYRLMKRGCRVRFLHFHSYPILSHASRDKVRELAHHLTAYQLTSRLYQVAFGDIQRQVMLSAPAPLRVVLYRRLMMRIAERLARRTRAAALVTGEAVGQVASQTLENIAVIDAAVSSLPILRPLVGSGQGRDYSRGAGYRDLPDLDHSRPGLLPVVHAASSGHEGGATRRGGGRARVADGRDGGRRGSGRRA